MEGLTKETDPEGRMMIHYELERMYREAPHLFTGKWSRMRTRPKVHRGQGSIQIADDDRRDDSGCYIDGETENLRFVQFNSPIRGNRMFLRICSKCLDVLAAENEALKQKAG